MQPLEYITILTSLLWKLMSIVYCHGLCFVFGFNMLIQHIEHPIFVDLSDFVRKALIIILYTRRKMHVTFGHYNEKYHATASLTRCSTALCYCHYTHVAHAGCVAISCLRMQHKNKIKIMASFLDIVMVANTHDGLMH